MQHVGLADPAVTRVAAIVHDLDLKDGRFGAVDAPTVGAVIDGLQLAYADDDELLEQGMVLFDALWRAFGRLTRLSGPRKVARAARASSNVRKSVSRRKKR